MHFLDTLQAGLGHSVMIIVFFQVLIKLIKPYTRIKIGFISGELNIDPNDVESLLVSCILDNTIYGRIDQVRHFAESVEIIPCDNPSYEFNATPILWGFLVKTRLYLTSVCTR